MQTVTRIVDVNAKDNRDELQYGYTVDGYEIVSLIGKGGSGITYKVRKAGENFVLKEVYPLYLSYAHYIERNSKKHIQVMDEEYIEAIKTDIEERIIHEEHCNKVAKYNTASVSTSAKAFRCEVLKTPAEYDANELFGYIVMDTIDGETLSNVFDRDEIDVRRALVLTRAVLESVIELHGKGLLHLDLTPYNCYFQKATGDELCVLIDFGSAMVIDELENKKKVSYPSFSYGYSAPEVIKYAQCNNELLTSEQELEEKKALRNPQIIEHLTYKVEKHRDECKRNAERIGMSSDYYSVGAILYYLICQEVYDSKKHHIDTMLEERLKGEYILIKDELSEIFSNCLCDESDERYAPSCDVENNQFIRAIDKLINLIDVIKKNDSHKELIIDDEGAEIEENYSELLFSCKDNSGYKGKSIQECIREWDSLQAVSTICGESGSGKTWFMKHFCMEVAKNGYAEYRILPKYVLNETQAYNYIKSIREYSDSVRLLVFIDKDISDAKLNKFNSMLAGNTKIIYVRNKILNLDSKTPIYKVDKIDTHKIYEYLQGKSELFKIVPIDDAFPWKYPFEVSMFCKVCQEDSTCVSSSKEYKVIEKYLQYLFGDENSELLIEKYFPLLAVDKVKQSELELCCKIPNVDKIVCKSEKEGTSVYKMNFRNKKIEDYFKARYISNEIIKDNKIERSTYLEEECESDVLKYVGNILYSKDVNIWQKILVAHNEGERCSLYHLNIISAYFLSDSASDSALKIYGVDFTYVGGLIHIICNRMIKPTITFERCIFDRTNFSYPNNYIEYTDKSENIYQMNFNAMFFGDGRFRESYIQYGSNKVIFQDGHIGSIEKSFFDGSLMIMDDRDSYVVDRKKKCILDVHGGHILYQYEGEDTYILVTDLDDANRHYTLEAKVDDNKKLYPAKISVSKNYVAIGYIEENDLIELKTRRFNHERWRHIYFSCICVYEKGEKIKAINCIKYTKAFGIIENKDDVQVGYLGGRSTKLTIEKISKKIPDDNLDMHVETPYINKNQYLIGGEEKDVYADWIIVKDNLFVACDTYTDKIFLYNVADDTMASIDVGCKYYPHSIRVSDKLNVCTMKGMLEYELEDGVYRKNIDEEHKLVYWFWNTLDQKQPLDFEVWKKNMGIEGEWCDNISMMDCTYIRKSLSKYYEDFADVELQDKVIELGIKNNIKKKTITVQDITLSILAMDWYNLKYMVNILQGTKFTHIDMRRCREDVAYRHGIFYEILIDMSKEDIEKYSEWLMRCSQYVFDYKTTRYIRCKVNKRVTDIWHRYEYPVEYSKFPKKEEYPRYIGILLYLIAEKIYKDNDMMDTYYEEAIVKILGLSYEMGELYAGLTLRKYEEMKKKNKRSAFKFYRKFCLFGLSLRMS